MSTISVSSLVLGTLTMEVEGADASLSLSVLATAPASLAIELGTPGAQGDAATIAVGTTTTLAPGSSATVANVGTSSAAVFNFGIPAGQTGATGATGSQGPQGDAATIAAGTTTTGAPGTSASVTNVGTSSAAVFNFTIPRGDKGETGNTGATGATGSPGAAATITAGSTTTGAPGTSASVTNSGTSSAAVFDFTIPRGDVGATGATGATGPAGPGVAAGGTTGQILSKASGASYDTTWSTIVPGDRYLTTSTTTLTIGTGTKSLTVGTGLSYTVTQNVTISFDGSNHMHGEVLAYDAGTGAMSVNVNHKTGSGTYSAWTVNVGGVTPVTSTAWGTITGTLSAQTDLQMALDAKLATANNLSELTATASTARTNLGLGTAAVEPATKLVPAGGTTGQVLGKLSNADWDDGWITPTASATWGSITGTLSSQTDLNTQLGLKAPIDTPTFTGKATMAASATGGAGFRLPPGVAPTTPVNGDIWTTTTNVVARLNNATQTLVPTTGATFTGKLITAVPATTSAGFNIPTNGFAPTTPVEGDIWTDAVSMKVRINGVTQSLFSFAGGTLTGQLITAASTTSGSGFRIPSGTAPTVPTNGDIWSNGSNLIFRVAGFSASIPNQATSFTYANGAKQSFAHNTSGAGMNIVGAASTNPTTPSVGDIWHDTTAGQQHIIGFTNTGARGAMTAVRALAHITITAGTPALTTGFNAASVTDNGVGDFTINFTNDITISNYIVIGSTSNSGASNGSVVVVTRATNSVRVNTIINGALTDVGNFSVAVMR